MKNEELFFGGYPITLELIGEEVIIHCKNVTGTLSQIEGFLNDKTWKRHYFGDCKIRRWRNNEIKIDCLKDSEENFLKLYKQIKKYKYE